MRRGYLSGSSTNLCALAASTALRAERQGERCSFVPGLPLIHVVRAEEISALAGYDVQCRLVEIGQIRRESLGWPMMAA